MKNKTILKIANLDLFIETKKVLDNFSLDIHEHEINFLMGPNGCGKSTLSKTLAGYPLYRNYEGHITFCNKDLKNLDPEIRSKEGLFLAFQYPIEIPGINNFEFLRMAYNEKQKFLRKKELPPFDFLKKLKKLSKSLQIKDEFLSRDLNVGFSGGEKKLNEIVQMLVLKPRLIILDEVDSGLDIDAIKKIFFTLSQLKWKNLAFLIITHNPKIADYIKPDRVHIMIDGKIQKSGDNMLLTEIDKYGYNHFKKKI